MLYTDRQTPEASHMLLLAAAMLYTDRQTPEVGYKSDIGCDVLYMHILERCPWTRMPRSSYRLVSSSLD